MGAVVERTFSILNPTIAKKSFFPFSGLYSLRRIVCKFRGGAKQILI
jgi:hypothetical protein